jgi:hypothetical protein
MITEILALLGSGPVGALIGGVLGYYNRKTDLAIKQLDHEQERAKWGHEVSLRGMDLEQVKAESAGKREVAQIEGEASAETARMEAIARAQASDRVSADTLKAAGKWGRFLLVTGQFIQTLVRPLLTSALVGVALWIGLELLWLLRAKTWGTIAPTEQKEMALQALSWVMAQASACIQYWMVSRGTGK